MATFDPAVAPTQPNSFLSNFSQGTDRASLQPLAEVPKLSEKYVQPDYKANLTAGKGLEDLGKLETAGVSLTDNIIKQNVDDTLTSGIDKIRNSFGVAQASDIESGVASAVGRGGNSLDTGTSLVDSTGKPPLVLQKLGTKVDGLTEAYAQGELSNSAYYAKLNAYVTQVKQQFPGYGDEIDQMTSSKVGTNPANALRSALQDDVSKLAAKVQSQNDKWTTYEGTNAQYIHTYWPDYEARKQNGTAPSQAEVRNVVGNLQARDYAMSSKTAALAVDQASDKAVASKAEDIATQKAGDIASHLTVGTTNMMGLKSPADFTQLLNDVRNGKRPPLTPEEKQSVTGAFATMEQQYGISFDKFANSNTDTHGLPQRPLASYTTPEKLAAIRTQGMQGIIDIKTGLLDDKYGILAQTSNWNKATVDAGEGDFLRKTPVAASIAAGRKFYGDNGITMLITSTPFLQSAALEGFRQFNQGELASGNSSLRSVFDTYKQEKVNDGTLNRAAISDSVSTILHEDKMVDRTAGAAAVKHVFGPDNATLLGAFNDKNQVDVFSQLTSKPMVEKIKKMDATSKQTFTTWADNGFATVFEAQAAQANQVTKNFAVNSNLNLVYDPGTANFTFKSAFRLPPFAQAQLEGLNTAINSMKEVFKMEGKDPTEALYGLLPVAGIEPGSPIYKAVQDEYNKAHKESTTGNG